MCNIKTEFISWIFFEDFIGDIKRSDIIHISQIEIS